MWARAALAALVPFIIDFASGDLMLGSARMDPHTPSACMRSSEHVDVLNITKAIMDQAEWRIERITLDAQGGVWLDDQIRGHRFPSAINWNVAYRFIERKLHEYGFYDPRGATIVHKKQSDGTSSRCNEDAWGQRLSEHDRLLRDNLRSAKYEGAFDGSGVLLTAQNLEISDNREAVSQEQQQEIRNLGGEGRVGWRGAVIAWFFGVILWVLGWRSLMSVNADIPGRRYLLFVAAAMLPLGFCLIATAPFWAYVFW